MVVQPASPAAPSVVAPPATRARKDRREIGLIFVMVRLPKRLTLTHYAGKEVLTSVCLMVAFCSQRGMVPDMSHAIRILGIDPGLNATGWGVIDQTGTRLSLVDYGVIKAPSKAPMSERLTAIYNEIEVLVGRFRPHEAAVEDQFVHASAVSALKLGQARAAAMLAPARAGLPVGEYAPKLVKKAVVGTGSAEKAQVAAMIAILLPGSKADADAADALAVAICHVHHRTAHANLTQKRTAS